LIVQQLDNQDLKESLPHGEFGKWLEEKVEFSQPTANRFMRASEAFENYSTLNNLTQSKIFALLDVPPEEREEFIQSNPVDDIEEDIISWELD
jgi:hypothetical protein